MKLKPNQTLIYMPADVQSRCRAYAQRLIDQGDDGIRDWGVSKLELKHGGLLITHVKGDCQSEIFDAFICGYRDGLSAAQPQVSEK